MKCVLLTVDELKEIVKQSATTAVETYVRNYVPTENENQSDGIVGLQEISDRYKRSIPTIRRLIKLKKIPAIKVGRKWSFDLNAVDAALRKGRNS